MIAHKSLETVDLDRVRKLLEESFGVPLKPTYFQELAKRVHCVYLTESYEVSSITTSEEES